MAEAIALRRGWNFPARRAANAAAWDVILPTAMATDEASIIQAVLDGEVDRYAELVDRYQEPARRLAFSLLGHYEDARDVSQDAFVNAYRALRGFRRGAKFSTWLYRIVVNVCADYGRRRARQPLVVATVGDPELAGDDEAGLFIVDVADAGANPGEQLAQRQLSVRLTRAIEALPLKQRTAFVLHHVHGCSLEETADVMRCRAGTIKSHIFRATAQLREQLAPWLKQEG